MSIIRNQLPAAIRRQQEMPKLAVKSISVQDMMRGACLTASASLQHGESGDYCKGAFLGAFNDRK